MFCRDNIPITFTAMHYPVLEHKDTLSFAFLVCIILYIDGKQFMCSVFTFALYNYFVMGLPVVNQALFGNISLCASFPGDNTDNFVDKASHLSHWTTK